MVPSRNNVLIVNKIGYVYSINLILNALWLLIFGQNAAWSFGLALVVISSMTATQAYIMRQTVRTKVNAFEFVVLRCGFTIYTGWVAAATIIGVTIFLKSLGMD